MVSSQLHYTKVNRFMPFLLAEILNFQSSTHRIGVGSFSNIKIYMSRPTLFDIPDDVQIRFNESDIVTGGRGYNAWWGKEYERREADDL